MKATAFLLRRPLPTTANDGFVPVNGLNMYYEVHGTGDPVVLLHGAFMTITNNWTGWIGELARTREVIAVEMQGHGRTADIPRDLTSENLSDDGAALLDHLKIPRSDLIGYSMGGAIAMHYAIRHPDKTRKVVVISSGLRRDGMVKEGLDALATLKAEAFRGSPLEADYRRLSPTPGDFPKLVKRLLLASSKANDLRADQLKASRASKFFIHGDIKPLSASRLTGLPATTHVTLMQRMPVVVPMVNDFLDAQPLKQYGRIGPAECPAAAAWAPPSW